MAKKDSATVALLLVLAACALPGGEVGLPRASFAERCANPDVLRCVGFEDEAEVAELHSRIARADGVNLGSRRNHADDLLPEIDRRVVASGTGSLRFTVPGRSGAGKSGSWFANFSDDLSARFGEGTEFYVQWRQRFSEDFLDTHYDNGGGWKQVIVGEGDRPNARRARSCTQLELVVQNILQRGYPQIYHSCGDKDGRFDKLPLSRFADYEAETWMTFQMHVKIGTWYRNDRNYRGDSRIELWVAGEGEASRRIIDVDYDLVNTDPAARYGKIWLLPYHTRKDPEQDHPTGYVWYDELIVSRAPIPDPL